MNADDCDDGPTVSRRRLLGLGVVAVPAAILLAGTDVATAAADGHVAPADAPAIQPTTGYVYFC